MELGFTSGFVFQLGSVVQFILALALALALIMTLNLPITITVIINMLTYHDH